MSDDLVLSRRASIRASLGVAVSVACLGGVTSGCEVRNPLDSEDQDAPASSGVTPDVRTAIEAVVLIRTAEAAATATLARHPGLKTRLTPILEMHRAHLTALEHAVPSGSTTQAPATPYVVRPRPEVALRQIAVVELGKRNSIIGLALRAQSGAFARLLAGISAATSQRLVGLPQK